MIKRIKLMMHFFAGLSLIFSVFANTASGAVCGSGSITGQVVSGSFGLSIPVKNAYIVLTDIELEMIVSVARSNSFGYFDLGPIPGCRSYFAEGWHRTHSFEAQQFWHTGKPTELSFYAMQTKESLDE